MSEHAGLHGGVIVFERDEGGVPTLACESTEHSLAVLRGRIIQSGGRILFQVSYHHLTNSGRAAQAIWHRNKGLTHPERSGLDEMFLEVARAMRDTMLKKAPPAS